MLQQQVSYLLANLLNRRTSGLAGTGIAMTLVWYLGPLVPGMSGPLPRAAAILVLALAWTGVVGAGAWRRRRRERALAAGVAPDAAPGVAPGAGPSGDAAEEVAQLRARVAAAVARLRGNRRRWGTLYEQPWFLLIGPPGAGKTTALANCGLRFPPPSEDAEDGAAGAAGGVGGVGGTRLCDWWFADEAVLIDTAGRYTTQDSDAAIDRAGWHGFLDMLRRTRPRQPVNGIIVVVSITDIAAAPAGERAAHARAIRRRVKEVSDRLRIEVPVYMVFSKADQLRGFTDHFDDLDADARRQIWGMTFPLASGVEEFAPEFRLLLDRLDSRHLERLQAERAPDRRAAAAGFALQAASVARPLEEFLRQAFGGTRLDPAPFLRGVYLASATQQGTPLDRLTGLLARSFGIDQQRAPGLRPVAGRSYFLHGLLHDVVLGEALLAGSRSRGERRRRWLRAGGFAATGALALAGLLALVQAEGSSRAAVLRGEAALGAYRAQLGALTLDPVADDDLPAVTPVLDSAAALPAGTAPILALPGLSQSGKLRQGAAQAYREALRTVLLPRLVWRLEAQMRARPGDPDFLYEATRVYLMLGGGGPLDPALVRDWEARDWAVRFPGALNADLRDHLAHHLAALLAEPLPPVVLDGALVASARAAFAGETLAARVYGRIRGGAATAQGPGWTAADRKAADWSPVLALDQGGAALFRRLSGAPLTDSIAGFYTGDGFRRVLLARLAAATRSVLDETWVLGRTEASPPRDAAPDVLERAVVALWVQDATARWDALLADLALAPLGERGETVKRLYVLSSPQSPMRDLLAAIVLQQTLLPPADARAQPAPVDARPAAAGAKALPDAADARTQPDAVVDPVAAEADAAMGRHYAALRALMLDGPAEAPLAGLLRLVKALQAELSRTGEAGLDVAAALQTSGEPASLLQAEADRQPVPVGLWLRQIAIAGRTMLGSNAASAARTAFAASTGPAPLCRQVVDGHYPFDSAARTDATLTDFARLFAPGGVLDSYFQSQVRPYADTGGPVWRARAVGGVAPPVDGAALASFQRAAAIRDAFFPAGGTVQVRFSVAATASGGDQTPTAATTLIAAATPSAAVTPRAAVTSSATATPSAPAPKATLTIGAASIAGGTGTPSPVALTWPADGPEQAGLAFDPAGAATPLQETGSWALFRLLARGRIALSGPGSFTVAFSSGDRGARFALRTESARNPFDRHLLEGFHCPVIR